jgi:hypothetical protein
MPPKPANRGPPPTTVFYINGFGADLAKKQSIIAARMNSKSEKDKVGNAHIHDLEAHTGPTGPRPKVSSNINNCASGVFVQQPADTSPPRVPFNDAKSSVVIPDKKTKMKLYSKETSRDSYMKDLIKCSNYGKTMSYEEKNLDFSPKPDMAAINAKRSKTPSAMFKSKTNTTRDSYVKASPGMTSGCNEGPIPTSPTKLDIASESARRSKTPSAVFKTKQTVGDAHIRAVPKQLDVLVAYKEMAGPK